MCNFPKVRLGGAAGCNGGPSAAADILGKLPLGKLHIWEVATWEIILGKLPFGKNSLKKYLTSRGRVRAPPLPL